MSRFYATIEKVGVRKRLTRCGHRELKTTCRGWTIGADVCIKPMDDGTDVVYIDVNGGSNSPRSRIHIVARQVEGGDQIEVLVNGERHRAL